MFVSQEGNLVTLINVFETQPQQQQALIEQWIRFSEEVKEKPGLIGAALHKSTDGTRVVNYAHWRSEADFDRFLKKHRAYMEATFARSPHASTHISTKWSRSLSGQAGDGPRAALSRESGGVLSCSRVERPREERQATVDMSDPTAIPFERGFKLDHDEAPQNQSGKRKETARCSRYL